MIRPQSVEAIVEDVKMPGSLSQFKAGDKFCDTRQPDFETLYFHFCAEELCVETQVIAEAIAPREACGEQSGVRFSGG